MSGLFEAQYRALFARLLVSHRGAAQRRPRAPAMWCAFWPMIGRKFAPGGLMIVGRAVNGWKETEFACEELDPPGGIEGLMGRCREVFAPADKCPMAWVERHWKPHEGYRLSRSQFWQTALRLAKKDGYSDQDWYSTLVWTNLMRVSPVRGGNPPMWSCFAQLEPAAELLDYELKTLQPAVAVFLTGREWYRCFQEKTDLFHLEEVSQDYVHYVGQHGRTRLIVSDHPQTRSPERLVGQIAEYWRARS